MEDLKCPICGEPTYLVYGKSPRKDRLCKKHGDLVNFKKLALCEKCGEYYETNIEHNCKNENTPFSKPSKNTETYDQCIICETNSNGFPQCRDCYYETQDFMLEYDKNKRIDQIRDHYYNLKDKIFRMRDIEIIQKNCNRLMAIAKLESDLHRDSSLEDKVIADIKSIIERTKKQEVIENEKVKNSIKEKDQQRTEIIRADDGHYVESDVEAEIDNVLYNAQILHCYGQSIIEILECRKKCDWFIPIRGTTQGIYIEYWGMKTEEYLKSRKEKEELYKKYNIPYIGIEKDEPHGDKQEFRARLIREIKKIAIERYKFMPEWS